MKPKKLVAATLAASLIVGINATPAKAAENHVIKEDMASGEIVVSKTDSLRQKKWIVDKEAWTETIEHAEEGHFEEVKVVDKEAWTEKVLVSPEEWHMEKQWVVDKEAWTETIEHLEEFHMENQWVVDKPAWDEPIYEEQIRTLCMGSGCGKDLTGLSDYDKMQHVSSHFSDLGYLPGWANDVVQVQIGTTHHPEEGHYEEVKVVDKEAWTETKHHPEEGHYEEVKVVDKEAVYDYIEHPEEFHMEKQWVVDKKAWTETIEHPEEGHYEYVYTDSVAGFVARLYTNLLQREADDNGLISWTDVLKSGKEQGVKVAQGFVESKEFQTRHLSDVEYIKILYRTFLGREADNVGLNSWLSVIDDGLSRMHVFKGFAESNEFTKICREYGIIRGKATLTAPMDQNEGVTKFIARCYKLCLGRKADRDGLNNWCNQLLTGANTAKVAAHGFVFSDEFKKKDLSDEDFVKTMYHVFMDRDADKAGLNAWLKVLHSGKNREHVFNGFADSPEFRKICIKYGVK